MNLIFPILIIIGAVWFTKKLFEDPAESKSNLLRQIKEIKQRVNTLEAEVRLLKGVEEPMYSKTDQDTMPEKRPAPAAEIFIKEQIECSEPEPIEYEQVLKAEAELIQKDEEPTGEFGGLLNKIMGNNTKEPQKKIDFESFITGNVINKIGVIALILGMGFFLNYTFVQTWISPIIKILTSTLTAILFLFGASWFNKTETYKIFVQGIAGAGIAILYLSVFAAYNFYHILNYPVAVILMLATATVAFSQALKYNSIATAILGIVGGFITPFIMSSGGDNFVELLTYLAFLNAWIVALAHKKTDWKAVEILGLFASYITYFSLQNVSEYSNNLIIGFLFLTIVWALYFWLDLSKIKRGIKEFTTKGNFLNIANGFIFYTGIYSLFNHNESNLIVFATFVIAIVYLISGIAIYYKYDKLDDYLKQNFFAFIILFSIATNIATTGFIKPIAFAIESFWILYVGKELNKAYIWKTATYLFSFASASLLFNSQTYSYAPIESFIPIFNMRVLAFIIVAALYALGAKTLAKIEGTQALQSYYGFSWCTLMFVLLGVEINDFVSRLAMNSSSQISQMISYNRAMIQVIVWMPYSIRLLLSGIKKNTQTFIIFGFIGAGIAILRLLANGLSFNPIEQFIPILNLRFIAFIITAFGLYVASKEFEKHKDNLSWNVLAQNALTYIWGALIFLLLGIEISDLATRLALNSSSNICQIISLNGTMLQVIAWSVYSVLLVNAGLNKEQKPFVKIGFTGLIIAICSLLINGTSYQPAESFIPILNLRFAAFALTAGSLFYLCKTLKNLQNIYSWSKNAQDILTYIWCGLLFILLNCEIGDYFSKNALTSQFSQQMVFGISWSLFSLPLINRGLSKKNLPLIICGSTVIIAALSLSFVNGFNFPTDLTFTALFNIRMLLFLMLVGSLIMTHKWLKNNTKNYSEGSKYLKALQILLSLFIFYIITIEIKDYYLLQCHTNAMFYENGNFISDTMDAKQLVTSVAWLIYSIGLIIFGILKRMKQVRYIALAILGITILKVFIFDLSFLNQLYRIISFMGMGVILLSLSFFYQKYSEQIKKLIQEDTATQKK